MHSQWMIYIQSQWDIIQSAMRYNTKCNEI